MGGHVKTKRIVSKVWRKKAILAFEGGGEKYERTLSSFYPRPPGFLFAARVFIWEAPVLPRPGLMRTAGAPTMETVCAL